MLSFVLCKVSSSTHPVLSREEKAQSPISKTSPSSWQDGHANHAVFCTLPFGVVQLWERGWNRVVTKYFGSREEEQMGRAHSESHCVEISRMKPIFLSILSTSFPPHLSSWKLIAPGTHHGFLPHKSICGHLVDSSTSLRTQITSIFVCALLAYGPHLYLLHHCIPCHTWKPADPGLY